MTDHGTNGPLHLTFASPWERGLENVFIAAQEMGMGVNPDVNSGNPIGMGLGAGCLYNGIRTTASAYLQGAPDNLTIKLQSPVAKVLVDGLKATGVRTVDGREFKAKKDVILSLGVSLTHFLSGH
jgi:choline dehydrogenase-like flavoprotein